jgi:similar to stage IV sporulation protein
VLNLWRYLLGYYRLQAVGWNLEKLINIAVGRGLNLWDIKRNEEGILFNASIYSFSQLKEISQRLNCSLTIEDRNGIPFFLARLKKRKTLFVGPVLLITVLYLLSSFIWTIEVNGLETIPLAEVLETASAAGLRVGVWRSDLEPRQIESVLMTKIDKTAWVGLEIQGTRAILKIVEKVVIPPEDLKPCNLIADKDGLVTEIIVLEGKQMVKKGQTVKKGDILISGLVGHEGELAQTPIRAKGIVKGKVWYEAYAESPLVKYIEERTGNTFRTISLKINDKTIITQYQKNIPFRYYQQEEYVKKVVLWRNLVLPVETIITTSYEINRIPEQVDNDIAVLEAKNNALNSIRSQISQEAKITAQEYTELSTGDSNLVRVRLLVEVEESLGKTVPLVE